MRGDHISRTQLMALLWAGVMAPAAQLLSGLLLDRAGRGAWLAAALTAPLVLAAGWLWGALAGREGPARAICRLLGRWPGQALLLIYMVWGQVLLTLRLRACAQRLLASGERDGALWFFVLTLAALLLWVGRGKLAAFARAGQLFLAALLAAAGVVLGLSSSRPGRSGCSPCGGTTPAPVPGRSGGDRGAGLGLFRRLSPGPGLAGGGEGVALAGWGLGGVLLLAAAQGVILGNLGPALASRLDDPFFALAKSVGVEGAFQRVEGIISACGPLPTSPWAGC